MNCLKYIIDGADNGAIPESYAGKCIVELLELYPKELEWLDSDDKRESENYYTMNECIEAYHHAFVVKERLTFLKQECESLQETLQLNPCYGLTTNT